MAHLAEEKATEVVVEQRWRSRRLLASLLRAGIFVVPMIVGFFAGWWVGNLMNDPVSLWQIVGWWLVVVLTASAAANLTDRLARKLLPLTLLLRMTMLFPDKAPSRIRIARRTGNIAELRRRISDIESGEKADLGEMSELILSLSTALSKHDRKTRGHSERTRTYTDMLAEEMGVPEEGRDKLRWAALLHDVGKLEVPVEILNKDGGLESEEWELIRQHPVNGMRLIAPLTPWLGEWAQTIEHHHERWDGTGYPHGLKGHEIFLGARIVAVADAYDVITSGRVYQKAKPAAQARREVAEQAGRQFDPAVARALMNVSLGRLRWATGPLAMLAEIPFIRGLPQTGRDIAAIATSSSVMAATLASGVVSIPATVTPAHVIETVTEQVTGTGRTVVASPDDQSSGGTSGTGGAPGTDPTQPAETTVPTTTLPSTTATTAVANQSPILPDVSATTPEGTLVTIRLSATDPDGDPLVCSMSTAPSVGAATVPSDCTRVTFQPPAGYAGVVTIALQASDGVAITRATATVTVVAANKPPVANPDSASTVLGNAVTINVLGNDSDPEGQALTVTGVTQPAAGSVTFTPGSVTFTPSQTGTFGFGYTVCDPAGVCSSGTVSVTVTAPAVTAGDDFVSMLRGDTVVVPVLTNDNPGAGIWDVKGITILTAPQHATASPMNSGKIKVVADRNYVGPDSFVYRACTTAGVCVTATVWLTIN